MLRLFAEHINNFRKTLGVLFLGSRFEHKKIVKI